MYLYRLGENKYEQTDFIVWQDYAWDSELNRLTWVGTEDGCNNGECAQRVSISNFFETTESATLPDKIYVDLEFDAPGGPRPADIFFADFGDSNLFEKALVNGINEVNIRQIPGAFNIVPMFTIGNVYSGSISKFDVYYYPNIYSGNGAGTIVDPYQISNCSQLQEVGLFVNSNFILTQDIDCSGLDFDPIGYSPAQNQGRQFNGVFDGQGYTISHLSINKPADNYVGLFSDTTSAAQIKNLNVSDISVIGESAVGSTTAQISNALRQTGLPILNCHGDVCSKKFEQISPKICRAGGIPPPDPPSARPQKRPFRIGRFQVFRSAFGRTLGFAQFGGKFLSL